MEMVEQLIIHLNLKIKSNELTKYKTKYNLILKIELIIEY